MHPVLTNTVCNIFWCRPSFSIVITIRHPEIVGVWNSKDILVAIIEVDITNKFFTFIQITLITIGWFLRINYNTVFCLSIFRVKNLTIFTDCIMSCFTFFVQNLVNLIPNLLIGLRCFSWQISNRFTFYKHIKNREDSLSFRILN